MLRKKSLGQHFLQSQHYLELVADAAQLVLGERIVEIGPGEGALTQVLLARGAQVVALEKDHRLIPVLTEKFAKEITTGAFILHEGDALEADLTALVPKNKKYKVVANIPYYITGALLRTFLTASEQPNTLVFLVQKEVAERIARSKKESILSLSVKAYGTPAYIKTVPRGAFVPPPTVDSAILAVTNISREHFKNTEAEEKFFELIKAGFAQKRKLLKSNLGAVLGKEALTAMEKAGMPTNARAEDVALEQWLILANN